MVVYTIETEGDFMTFAGIVNTVQEGKKRSYRKASIKRIVTKEFDNGIIFVSIDDNTIEYRYTEVIDPRTGVVFVDLLTFRSYIMNNMSSEEVSSSLLFLDGDNFIFMDIDNFIIN